MGTQGVVELVMVVTMLVIMVITSGATALTLKSQSRAGACRCMYSPSGSPSRLR
jgi:hypothetical protein